MGCGRVALCCINVARWAPVVFVIGIVSWAYYAYVYQLVIMTLENVWLQVLYLAVFHILLILFLWAYFATVFAPLDKPGKEFRLNEEALDEVTAASEESEIKDVLSRYVTLQRLPIRTRAFEGGIRYCPKCVTIKPDRSHHCSICSQCVLKFDHHCPWVNTCVSFNNYKFFLLFLMYGFILCLWGALTDLPFFIQFWQHNVNNGHVQYSQFHVVFLFFVSAMFSASLGCLFFYHLLLTGRNRTTLEAFRPPIFSHGPDKRAYDLGISRNYRQIFGPRPILWILPIFSSLGDGINFPSRLVCLESARLLEIDSAEDEEDIVFSNNRRPLRDV